MPCHNPRFATQDEYGLVTLKHSRLQAVLDDGEYLELSCQSCGDCRGRRVRDKAIRSYHESLLHWRAAGRARVSNNCFITLTYNDSTLPPHSSLRHSDWQNFAKKVRRDLGPFRYLMCGEYGGQTHRPHYHACIFGMDFHSDRKVWKQTEKSIEWRSPTLEEMWPHGFSSLAPLNFATASYVAGYIMKKLRTSNFSEAHAIYGKTAKPIFVKKEEYTQASKRPGLGADFFKKYWHEIYPRDRVRIEGKEYIPPKFYDKLLKERDPAVYHQVMSKRLEWLDQQEPSTDQELAARKANHEARLAQRKKKRHENADLLST